MTKVHSTQFHVTPDIAALMEKGMDFGPYIHQHLNGEWGDITEAERIRNPESLSSGKGHVLSARRVTADITIWITTKAGSTIVMLPLA